MFNQQIKFTLIIVFTFLSTVASAERTSEYSAWTKKQQEVYDVLGYEPSSPHYDTYYKNYWLMKEKDEDGFFEHIGKFFKQTSHTYGNSDSKKAYYLITGGACSMTGAVGMFSRADKLVRKEMIRRAEKAAGYSRRYRMVRAAARTAVSVFAPRPLNFITRYLAVNCVFMIAPEQAQSVLESFNSKMASSNEIEALVSLLGYDIVIFMFKQIADGREPMDVLEQYIPQMIQGYLREKNESNLDSYFRESNVTN